MYILHVYRQALLILIMPFLVGCATNALEKTTEVSQEGVKYAKNMQSFSDSLRSAVIDQSDNALKNYRKRTSNENELRVFISRELQLVDSGVNQVSSIKSSSRVLQGVFEDLGKLSRAEITDNNSKAIDGLASSINDYNKIIMKDKGIETTESGKIAGLLTKLFDGERVATINKNTKVLAKPVGELILLNNALIRSFHTDLERTSKMKVRNNKIDMISDYVDASKSFSHDLSDVLKYHEILDGLIEIEKQSDEMYALWSDYVKGESDINSLENHFKDLNGLLGYVVEPLVSSDSPSTSP